MSYNPIVDLVLGLFLITLPVVVMSVLAYLLFFHHSEGAKTSNGDGHEKDWDSWVAQTLSQACTWRDRFKENGAFPYSSDQDGSLTEKDLEELIRTLENLKEKPASSSERLPATGQEKATPNI